MKNFLKPCGMYEWFDCHLQSCGSFTEYFPAAQPRITRALQLKTVVQNASLEAELLDMMLIL